MGGLELNEASFERSLNLILARVVGHRAVSIHLDGTRVEGDVTLDGLEALGAVVGDQGEFARRLALKGATLLSPSAACTVPVPENAAH